MKKELCFHPVEKQLKPFTEWEVPPFLLFSEMKNMAVTVKTRAKISKTMGNIVGVFH